MIAPHKEWFNIYTFQEDENGRARVQTLCEYMQEAAGNHAAKLGLSIERLHSEGVAWVLARMRVVPVSLPAVHARIEVETWPVGVEGLQYRRDFVVRDDAGIVIVRAVSHWVVVSLDTRKVGRVPAFITQVSLDNTMAAMEDDGRRRLPEAGKEHTACAFRARLADVDRNHHVNNVRYMEWILESVPEQVRRNAALADLEIRFRAESYRDDRITALAMPDAEEIGDAVKGPRIFIHSLVREGDAKELVRARSVWHQI